MARRSPHREQRSAQGTEQAKNAQREAASARYREFLRTHSEQEQVDSAELFVGDALTEEQQLEQDARTGIAHSQYEELQRRAALRRQQRAQERAQAQQRAMGPQPSQPSPNGDHSDSDQAQAVMAERRAQQQAAAMGAQAQAMGKQPPEAMGKPPPRGMGDDNADMTEADREALHDRQAEAARAYAESVQARRNMGMDEPIKEHQVVPVRVVSSPSEEDAATPVQGQDAEMGTEMGMEMGMEMGLEMGMEMGLEMGAAHDSAMRAVQEGLERLSLNLHAAPPLLNDRLEARVGQVSVFCIQNPLQHRVDLTRVRGSLQASNNKGPRFPIVVGPGINANPKEIVNVLTTGESRMYITATTLCAAINVTRPGSYLASIQVAAPSGSIAPLDIIGSPFEVVVEPGVFDAASASVHHGPLRIALDHKTGTTTHVVKVLARDKYRNALRHGGDSVYARYVGAHIYLTTVTDHHNGTYTLTTTISHPGKYRIDALLLRARHPTKHFTPAKGGVRGKPLAHSPYFLVAAPARGKRVGVAVGHAPCTLSAHRREHNPLWNTPGSWVHKSVLNRTHSDWGIAVATSYYGQYRWVYEQCVPRIVTPATSESCLQDQWIHIIGDGTSRDLYRLTKALLVTAEQNRAPEPSVSQQLRSLVSPYSWWSGRDSSLRVFRVMGYDQDRQSGSSLGVYHYRSNDKNIDLTWSPFRDTPFLRKRQADVFSRLRHNNNLPSVVVVSLSTIKLCDLRHDEFVAYVQDLIPHVTKSFEGRIIWLIPPAVHDSVYHERFRACSYQKIQRRAEVLKLALGGNAEIVDLWQMSASRPDATSDGTRYVWATDPEPVDEDIQLDAENDDTGSVFFESGVDGFLGPVGWSMANLLLNHVCPDTLNNISPQAAAELDAPKPKAQRGAGIGVWVFGLLIVLGASIVGLYATRLQWFDSPHSL